MKEEGRWLKVTESELQLEVIYQKTDCHEKVIDSFTRSPDSWDELIRWLTINESMDNYKAVGFYIGEIVIVEGFDSCLYREVFRGTLGNLKILPIVEKDNVLALLAKHGINV